MTMTNLRKFHSETLDALDILLKNFRSKSPVPQDPERNEVKIDILASEFKSDVNAEAFFDIVHALKKDGIKLKEYDKYDIQKEAYEEGARNTSCAEVTIPSNFEEVYKKLCIEYGGQAEQSKVSRQTTKADKMILHLNSAGDLWRDPKDKHCYPMSENSDRYKIVRYLVQNRGYQQTSSISQEIGGKNEQVIRTEIQKINSNFKNHFGIKIGKLIEGKKDSGYKINYSIKTEEVLIRS